MFNNLPAAGLQLSIFVGMMTLGCFFTDSALAQSSSQPLPQSHHLTVQPMPEIPPDLNTRPPRAVQRIGTAIPPPRNTVSIKSTDAGAIPRTSPMSGCINCGVVDFVHKMTQGPGLNAIIGGVVAGTVARGVAGQMQHPSGAYHPGHHDHPNHHGTDFMYPYQAGITMSDGRQVIVSIPDGANFQQGDQVKWVDGVLVLDRPVVPDNR